jgi:hypothetical protein
MSEQPLTAILRLLFDGKDEKTVADAIMEALDNDDTRWRLHWATGDSLPITHIYSVDREMLEYWLDSADYEFTGADADVFGILAGLGQYIHHSAIDHISDSCQAGLIDMCKERGLVKEKGQDTSEVTP